MDGEIRDSEVGMGILDFECLFRKFDLASQNKKGALHCHFYWCCFSEHTFKTFQSADVNELRELLRWSWPNVQNLNQGS